mmetsp:Transcript_19922/g.34237  ORF Transcript_19922/g.34237 Transcript_19922/m.34237 type:complete len:239 (-) Transcript_19922:593-1309(-)|eukprot:CAMPEP_0184696438 /NCGR_PEP_ID=MMETSP0313-20130426/3733_1 /TAXON_ID=2792 /ORGANISM="Porphyridium aerugineum, Strain SAG 1380-2" /LENGTH=238 /DNA_ID=CAMNT_0027155065 /DNA_START=82 /DNA_END=798 /DNA_ORIENTATION=-
MDSRTRLGRQLLFHADQGNVVDVIHCLDDGASINAQDSGGLSSLMHACRHLDIELVWILLDRGCDLNLGDMAGCTGLMYACLAIGNGQDRMTSVSVQDRDWGAYSATRTSHTSSLSSYHSSSSSSRFGTLSQPSSLGSRNSYSSASTNHRFLPSTSTIHAFAAASSLSTSPRLSYMKHYDPYRHQHVIKLLLERGADIMQRDVLGKTAMDWVLEAVVTADRAEKHHLLNVMELLESFG